MYAQRFLVEFDVGQQNVMYLLSDFFIVENRLLQRKTPGSCAPRAKENSFKGVSYVQKLPTKKQGKLADETVLFQLIGKYYL